MKEELIAPCGMNCSLCVSYIFGKHDLNKKGFHKSYCAGCIPRGKNCTFSLAKHCSLIANGKIRFCYECDNYPCKELKNLDKRYREKYHYSMIESLNYIKQNGVDKYLKKETEEWSCKSCGDIKCCHNGLCLNCDIDILKSKKFKSE